MFCRNFKQMQTTLLNPVRIFANKNIRVMNVKLTLTVNKSTIEKAKKYAKKNGKSISSLVENYLNALVIKDGQAEEFSPVVMQLLGAVNAPANFNYKEELSNIISKKHA